MSIAVVIPFYQRDAGLLERALRSVLAQRGVDELRIVVIDDASPIPPIGEIERLGTEQRFPIAIIAQPNAGPAAARNRGLNALDGSIRRIAFLDSDDVWDENHLQRATRALDLGHDFYFANFFQTGQTVGAFERAGRIDPSNHQRLDDAEPLYSYRGDMFDQVITGNVIGTSTVVYDFDRFRKLRFDEAYYSAGEDYLFWIACERAGARFCFSPEIEVTYGFGINVYSGSGWGTDGFLQRAQNEMRYRKRLLQEKLSVVQRTFVQHKIEQLRLDFASDVIHRLAHRRRIPGDVLKAQLRIDPQTLAAIPIQAGQLVAKRLKGRAA